MQFQYVTVVSKQTRKDLFGLPTYYHSAMHSDEATSTYTEF